MERDADNLSLERRIKDLALEFQNTQDEDRRASLCAEIFGTLKNMLERMVFARFKSREDREDALQDLYLYLLKTTIPKYSPDKPIMPWIAHTTYCFLIVCSKKLNCRRAESLEMGEISLRNYLYMDKDEADMAEIQDDIRKLQTSKFASNFETKVIQAIYLDGLTYEEAAELLNVGWKQVENARQRWMVKARKRMGVIEKPKRVREPKYYNRYRRNMVAKVSLKYA